MKFREENKKRLKKISHYQRSYQNKSEEDLEIKRICKRTPNMEILQNFF